MMNRVIRKTTVDPVMRSLSTCADPIYISRINNRPAPILNFIPVKWSDIIHTQKIVGSIQMTMQCRSITYSENYGLY